MVKCLLVPDASLVENKFVIALRAAEAHGLIVHISVPHKRHTTVFSTNFFEVLDVDVNSREFTQKLRLVENDLLSMRQQLSVEAEMMHLRQSSWHGAHSVN